MKKRVLETETVVPQPRIEVFNFFLDPNNLSKITPPDLKFSIKEASPLPIEEGTVILYKLKLMGFSLAWVSKIIDFNPPAEFKDIQLKGPYSYWKHTHTFQAEGSGTRIKDRVEYSVPGGPFEPLIHSLLVKKQLKKIFHYRTRKIKEIFGSQDSNSTTR